MVNGCLLKQKPWEGCSSLCLGAENQILVVDETGHSVFLVDAHFNEIIWQSRKNSLRYPSQALWVDPFFWICDRFNHRIVILNSAGHTEKVLTDKTLLEPFSLCRFQERVFVTDTESRLVHCFDMQGKKLPYTLGKQGFSLSYYESHMFQSKTVVSKWQRGTDFFKNELSPFFANGFKIGHINRPRGIFAHEGHIFIADPTGTIVSFDAHLEFSHEWSSGRVRSPCTEKETRHIFQGIEWICAMQDKLYFTSGRKNSIWQIDITSNTLLEWKVLEQSPGFFNITPKGTYVVYPFVNEIQFLPNLPSLHYPRHCLSLNKM